MEGGISGQTGVVYDKGHAWLVLLGATVTYLMYGINVGCLGIFLVTFLDYFNMTKPETAWIAGCTQIAGSFIAFALMGVTDYVGTRMMGVLSTTLMFLGYFLPSIFPHLWVVYAAFGVLRGTAVFTGYSLGMVVINQYFRKRKALASGVAVFGVSVGVAIWPPITELLKEAYGMRGMLLVYSAISLNLLICALIFRPNTSKLKQAEKNDLIKEVKSEQAQGSFLTIDEFMVEYFPFAVYVIGWMGIMTGHVFIHSYMPLRGREQHISAPRMAFLMSMIGMSGGLVRLAIGCLGDLRLLRSHRVAMLGLSGVAGGTLLIIFASTSTYHQMAVICLLYGIAGGGYMGLQAAAYTDVLDVKHAARGSGFITLGLGLAMLLTNVITGWLLKVTDSTDIPSIVSGAIQLCGGLLVMAIPLIHRAIKIHYKTHADIFYQDQIEVVNADIKQEIEVNNSGDAVT